MHYNHALGIEPGDAVARPTLPRRRSSDDIPSAAGIGALPVDAMVRAASAIAAWARVPAPQSSGVGATDPAQPPPLPE
ncbi:hypothetical protein [Nocardia bovistercoris]|uniref:Uncharacterized protein n=1 Tax=Nocardia bovistercoris TaxID=2785916 RepID=A0A931I7U5_9NOCA|nr:hypothetical protein [Nocardia bovistercoris]MBH0776259.1 hypothetical protein [Nocardia bovistercoris]